MAPNLQPRQSAVYRLADAGQVARPRFTKRGHAPIVRLSRRNGSVRLVNVAEYVLSNWHPAS